MTLEPLSLLINKDLIRRGSESGGSGVGVPERTWGIDERGRDIFSFLVLGQSGLGKEIRWEGEVQSFPDKY